MFHSLILINHVCCLFWQDSEDDKPPHTKKRLIADTKTTKRQSSSDDSSEESDEEEKETLKKIKRCDIYWILLLGLLLIRSSGYCSLCTIVVKAYLFFVHNILLTLVVVAL